MTAVCDRRVDFFGHASEKPSPTVERKISQGVSLQKSVSTPFPGY